MSRDPAPFRALWIMVRTIYRWMMLAQWAVRFAIHCGLVRVVFL